MTHVAATPDDPVPADNPAGRRYLYVDALRGIAAAAVVLHHALHATVMDVTFHRTLPAPVLWACEYGSRGVQVFFVISGFVIAHSLRRTTLDARGSLNFIVRRQVRLDPPYWAMIVVTLVDVALENHVPSLTHKQWPGGLAVLANALYLQNVTGGQGIVLVAWTLCLEIQFYAVFLLVSTVGRSLSPTRANPAAGTVWFVWATGIGCLCLVMRQFVFAAWAPADWPYFAFGVAAYWATVGCLPRWAFAVHGLAFAVATAMAGPFKSYMFVGLATGVSLYAAATLGRMGRWGANGGLQYLGRLSYSIYLVHLLVLGVILRGGYKLTGESRPAAAVWFVLAIVATVAVADVFHRLVERPSMQYASLLKRTRVAAPVPITVPT